MRTTKGVFLGVIVVSLAAALWVLPTAVKAMPPGSVRIWLFGKQIAAKTMRVVFHDPADLTSGPGGQSRFERLEFDESYENEEIHTYNDTTKTVYAGQSVAVTSVIWFDEPEIIGEQHMHQAIPYLNDTSKQPWGPRMELGRERHSPPYFSAPHDIGIYCTIDGDRSEKRFGRPSVIESVVYTAPDVAVETTYATHALYYLSQSGAAPSLVGSAHEAFLKVVPRSQKVEVTGGPVVVDTIDGAASRLFPVDSRGQTIITSSDVKSCLWLASSIQSDCQPDSLTTIGLYVNPSSVRTTAWSTLARTMSKLAQERGTFITSDNNADITNGINDFLKSTPNIWKSARGEVLFVTTANSVTVDPPEAITVEGKKIVVFTNAASVTWSKNVTVPSGKTNSPFHKFATIVFTDNSGIELLGDRYDGAFISKGNVTIGGIGSTAIINGLIVAQKTLNVSRSVDPGVSQIIARITYDPSFQNGTVVGLSPFVLPLVSEGTDR